MTTEPTDAELKAMWQLHAADIGGIFCYARAVLAKWGQPAQTGDAVATVQTIHGVTVGYLETAVPVGTKLYTASQPVEREPLTPEQVVDAFCKRPHTVQFVEAFLEGVRFAERHHGIKGGQHGDAKP